MLDKKTEMLLKLLNKLLGTESYKVVSSDEILNILPKHSGFDSESIKLTIDYLNKHEYISLKFEDEKTICYTLLPKARVTIEQTPIDKKVEEATKKHKIPNYLPIIIFLCSFCGTFLACVLYYFIFIR